jgi:acyl carrier protein
MNSKESIKEFILSELINDPNIENLEDRDPLIETGIIDSLGIMKLLAFLEETFSIHIPDGEIIPENFECIEAISLLVQNKKF